MTCHGETVKNQNEFWLFYTFNEIGHLGQLKINDAVLELADYQDKSECLSDINADRLLNGAYEGNLYLRVTDKAIGADEFEVEVMGTEQSGNAIGTIQSITKSTKTIELDTGEGTDFAANAFIRVSGSTDGANDGVYKIASVTGDNLVIDATFNAIKSDQLAVGGTVTKLTTKEVTISGYAQIGQLFEIEDPTNKWKTIDFVNVKSTSDPTVGSSLDVIMLPSKADFSPPHGSLINFDNGFKMTPGTTSKAIANKFNPVDHYKRIRGENTFSVSQFYTVFNESLQYLRDRDFTLKVEVHEDGAANIKETYFLSKVRLNVPLNVGGDGAEANVDADGNFRDFCIL